MNSEMFASCLGTAFASLLKVDLDVQNGVSAV